MKHSAFIKEMPKNSICFTILMALVWSQNILTRYVRVFLMKIPYIWQHVDMMISLVYIAFFCFALFAAMRELYVKELLITFLFYGVFYLHYLIFPLNSLYYEDYQITVIKEVFPMFLVGICTYRINREQTIKVLNTISLITVFTFAVYVMFFESMETKIQKAGDMHSAYLVLPHLCLVFSGILRKVNLWNIGVFILGSVILLFLGNRGSLLCLGVFVIVSILFSGRVKRPVLFLLLATGIMLALFSFGLLDFLYEQAEKLGFSLRIFQKLESREITGSSGRDKISSRVWEYIMLYPLMGMGIFSDRRVAGGFYAHNIVLEFMIEFGIIVGVLLFIFWIYYLVSTFLYLRKKDDPDTIAFYLSLVFGCCFKLFLSNSYLMEPYFFFTLGFVCAALKERNQQKLIRKKKPGLRRTLGRGGSYER